MAMLISKFHRLIQSRLLWAAFLVIVVFSFVIWGTQMPTSNKGEEERSSPGKLNGQWVSMRDFQKAYNNSHLAVMMAMGREFKVTPEIDAQLKRAGWFRLATMAEAKKLGLTADPDEIANAIQSNPAFATEDGQFSKPGYKAFVQQFLNPRGISEKGFEDHVAEEILLQKMRFLIGRSVLIPPADMQRTFSSVSDRFQIEHVTLGPELVKAQVKVTEQDAKAFFDKDPAAFEQPEKVTVKYVRLAVAPFIPKAKVEPELVQAYYDQNMDKFLLPTNQVAASTNALFASKYKPFEEVKQEISNLLLAAKARDDAADEAMNTIVLKMTRNRDGKALTFEQAAAEAKLTIAQVGPFAEYEKLETLDVDADFNRAAFALTKDEEGYFSDVIRGSNYMYVAALVERLPTRIPAFDEIKKDALPLAEAQALSDALGNKAKEIRNAAVKAVKAGQSFASALAPFQLKPATSGFFTASTGPSTNAYGPLLMRGIMPLNQGEVSEILPAPDAILLAYVAQRQPGDPTTYDSLKQQIEMSLRRQSARMVFDEWQENLLRSASFEARNLKAAVEDEEPAEADAPPAAKPS